MSAASPGTLNRQSNDKDKMAEIYNFNDEVSAALGSAITPKEIIAPRIIEYKDVMSATSWVVNGIIPEGVGVISGSGGVGKTSSIVPLALAVAGFKSQACSLEVELPRKVVYITEDDSQVMQIIQGMRIFLEWDDVTWERVKSSFIVVRSERIDHYSVEMLLNETLIYGVVDPVFTLPLVVFDTASANFFLENESANSEASLFMSVLKQFHSKHNNSIWVISHLSKVAKGLSIDNMSNATSRGAGAWGDDAMWTAILGPAEEDGKGHRVLRMDKVRAALNFNEISFEGSVQHTFAINRFGDEVQVDYRYTVPMRSSQDLRQSIKYEKRASEIETEIIEAVTTLHYPSKKQIKEHINRDTALIHSLINEMLSQGVLSEIPFPPGIKISGRNSYIALQQKHDDF